jgi:AraC family transcriptional regulator of adaptative response/methylated-DNA-[protein]-cysteine methyltransferase
MEIIHQKAIQTPLGEMIACATDQGICLLEFTDRKNIEKQLKALSKKQLKAEIIEKEHLHFKQLEKELKEYLKERDKYSKSFIHNGNQFQEKVWQLSREIPMGEIRTYKQQSEFLEIRKRFVLLERQMESIKLLF